MFKEEADKAHRLLEEADKYLEQSKIEEAEHQVLQALALLEGLALKNGDNTAIWECMGDIYFRYMPSDPSESSRKAVQVYLKAIDPHLDLVLKLANAYSNLDSDANRDRQIFIDTAIGLGNLYVDVRPYDYMAWSDLGSFFRVNGRFEEAEKCYRRSLEINPSFVRAITLLSSIYKEKHDYTNALEMLRKRIDLEPEVHHGWMNMARVYFEMAMGPRMAAYKQEYLDKAIECMKEALEKAPSSWGMWQDLANYYWIKGDLEAAVDCRKRSEQLRQQRSPES